MTIVTINREPSWGDLAVGAVVNLPPALADPLIASGEAVPTPDGVPTQAGPYATTSGGGTVRLTVAAFAALEAADGLTADVEYYCYDGPARWMATGANTKDALIFVQDGITYEGDQALAEQTEIDLEAGTWATRPTTFDVAGVVYYRRMTDIGTAPGGTVMSWFSGTSTEWGLIAPLRLRLRGAGTVTTSAQYPTNTRHALPAGFLAGCSRFDVQLKVAQSDETSTLDSWRLKLGSTGTATDATIFAPTGQPLNTTENQRSYNLSFNIDSATSIKMDGQSAAANVGWVINVGGTAEDAAVSLTGSDDTGDALYLGLDYTMNTCNTALTATVIVTLYPL